jgi:hypothetical protein
LLTRGSSVPAGLQQVLTCTAPFVHCVRSMHVFILPLRLPTSLCNPSLPLPTSMTPSRASSDPTWVRSYARHRDKHYQSSHRK